MDEVFQKISFNEDEIFYNNRKQETFLEEELVAFDEGKLEIEFINFLWDLGSRVETRAVRAEAEEL